SLGKGFARYIGGEQLIELIDNDKEVGPDGAVIAFLRLRLLRDLVEGPGNRGGIARGKSGGPALRRLVRALGEFGQRFWTPFLFRRDILQPGKQALRESTHRLPLRLAGPHRGDAPTIDWPYHARRGQPRAQPSPCERGLA